MAYKLNPLAVNKTALLTQVDGVAVNLTGKENKQKIAATKDRPAYEKIHIAATQKHLEAIHKRGDALSNGMPLVVKEEK